MMNPEKIDIELLSKEDLIKIIAEMHNTIQDWDNGYGLSSDIADDLIKVGRSSTEWCQKHGWEFDVNYTLTSPIKNKNSNV